MKIESPKREDLPRILDITRTVGVFNDEEVATVDELFQGYITDPIKSGYNFLIGLEGENILGFACWGPTSLTKGTVDLYWIATAPEAQGKGVGRSLFNAVEDAARAIGRWQAVIWTSSSEPYAAARALYGRMGCKLMTQIPDFYDDGEDLCVFFKRFG
jgi:GNAT superfamily N-acetyltransferase